MRIKKLKIEGYKNLEIEFVHDSDIIALIGKNGSGKSNLLEALSYIFKSLYDVKESVSFDYAIEYVNSLNQTIKIIKEKSKILFFLNDKAQVSIKDYLPKKLIAIYSGEEDRLWQGCFQPVYESYVKKINATEIKGIAASQVMPQMLYLNKFYWHLSLLSLVLSDAQDNISFVRDVLKIKQVDKIKFDFKKGNYEHYSNSLVLDFIKSIDIKSEYTLQELKEVLAQKNFTPDDIYKYLYIAFTPKGSKIIDTITIKFNEHLTLDALSEGEKKLLLVKAAFEFAEQEDSLFILDEPDAHVHLNNKEQIIKAFDPYKGNRQIILTTHSPTITQAFNAKNLYMLDEGKAVDKNKQAIINDLTGEFWNKHEQNIFITSEKPIVLFVEGKHDKTHIEHAVNILKDEYSDLNFDVFNMDGASNIPQIMTGLRTSDIAHNKLFIGVFDNDEEGKYCCNQTQVNYNSNKKSIKKGFSAICYPKPEGYNGSSELTVENLFDSKYYQQAYNEIVTEFNFENKSIESISSDIKKKAKGRLSGLSMQLQNKNEFSNFRPLFDLIKEIYQVYKNADNQSFKPTTKATTKIQANKKQFFYIKKKGIMAKGIFNEADKTFSLLRGSEVLKEYTPSTKELYKAGRDKKLKGLKLTQTERCYKLEEDVYFDTPSGAAKFVNGGTLNGWKEWKNEDGLNLDNVFRSGNN